MGNNQSEVTTFEATPAQDLLFDLRPIVFLHPDEEFLPSSIDYILQHSEIYNDDLKVVKEGEVNPKNLLKYQEEYGDSLQVSLDRKIYHGESNLKQVPFYVNSYETNDHIIAQYSFIYPYNGSFMVCKKAYGQHPFDLEHISISIDKKTKEIDRVYYGAHRSDDGVWVKREDIQFEGKRPIVYSAINSHGCYWDEGTWYRVFFLANDKTARGYRWDPENIYHYEDGDWNDFQGKIGSERTAKYHRWYGHEVNKSSTFCQRLFCLCSK